MNVILFSMYYCKLQVIVAFGLYRTSYPLDVNWRWRFWLHRHQARQIR